MRLYRKARCSSFGHHCGIVAPLFVVVSGPPDSGNATLASPLAVELGLLLVAKDTIKVALMSVLAVPDVDARVELRLDSHVS